MLSLLPEHSDVAPVHTQATTAVVRGFNAGSLLNTYATVASGLGALVRSVRVM